MDNLNNIPNSGNWGDAASKLNDNFNKVKQAVTTIENTSKNNKGYFSSLSALNTAFPNPKAGQTAYVYSEASSTKYYIYNAFNGGWVTASVEAPSIGVDISEYTKTGGSTKTTKQIDDSISQLEGEMSVATGWIDAANKNLSLPVYDGPNGEAQYSELIGAWRNGFLNPSTPTSYIRENINGYLELRVEASAVKDISYVTTKKIDVTSLNAIEVEMENISEGSEDHIRTRVNLTNSYNEHWAAGTVILYKAGQFARQKFLIDVSNRTGLHYLQIYVSANTASSAYIPHLKVYSVNFISKIQSSVDTENLINEAIQTEILSIPRTGDISLLFNFSSGLIRADNGGVEASETVVASDYVYIKGVRRLQITMFKSTATSLFHGLAFYDENKIYITGEKSIHPVNISGTWGWKNINVPNNAVYIRTTYYPDTTTFKCIAIGERTSILGNITENISFTNKGLDVIENIEFSTATSLITSEYFFVNDATHLLLTMIKSTASGSLIKYGIAFYDEDRNHIGYVLSKGDSDVFKAEERDIVVPDGAVFARTVYWENLAEIGGTEFYCYAYRKILTDEDRYRIKISNFQKESNVFDSFIDELYITGEIKEELDYVISSAGYSPSSGNCSIAISSINSLGERNLVAQFVMAYTDSPNSYVLLSERNDSGISGFAIVDWNKAYELGELFLNTEIILSNKAYDINYHPSIKAYHNSDELSFINLEPVSSVVYTAMNYIIKDEEFEGVRYLLISNDLGQTWNQIDHTFGEITHFHIFSNGEMMFATLQNKCFHVNSALDTVTESTVIDYDGSLFVPDAIQHFYQSDQRNYIFTIDDVEIHAWGDYSLGMGDDPNYISRVWYTTDNGVTIKCALKFGTTLIDGSAIGVRHTHGLYFNRYNNKFYIPTGDSNNECQLIEGEYNPTSDSWEFHRLGMGQLWKFGRMYFDELFTYLITDYTHAGARTGILKCRTTELNDITKYQYLYSEPNGQALSSYDEDLYGNKIITPDYTGAGFIYYATGDLKFKKVNLSRNVVVSGITSANYNGDVYARTSGFPYQLSNRMYNLSKSIRQSGLSSYHAAKLIKL